MFASHNLTTSYKKLCVNKSGLGVVDRVVVDLEDFPVAMHIPLGSIRAIPVHAVSVTTAQVVSVASQANSHNVAGANSLAVGAIDRLHGQYLTAAPRDLVSSPVKILGGAGFQTDTGAEPFVLATTVGLHGELLARLESYTLDAPVVLTGLQNVKILECRETSVLTRF